MNPDIIIHDPVNPSSLKSFKLTIYGVFGCTIIIRLSPYMLRWIEV